MKRKIISILMVVALSATMLAGCGDSTGSSEGGADTADTEATEEVAVDAGVEGEIAASDEDLVKKTMEEWMANGLTVEDTDLTGEFTYWSAFTGDSAVWDQLRVDVFNEMYKDKGIKCNVQFVPDSAGINNGKLLSAIAGGQAPDLIISDASTAAYQYAANGSFEDMSDALQEVNLDIDSFYEGLKDVIYYKDVPYLIPQDTNVFLLYYNPDIVKEAGLDPANPPKTLDELDAWGEAMTVQEENGSYSRFGFIPWLDMQDDAFTLPFLFGADIYDANTNTLNMTDPAVVKYGEWIQKYGEKYDPEKIQAFTSGLGGMFSPDHAFMTGRVGMTITGNWFANALKIYAPDVNYEVCAIPVPEGGRANSTAFGTNVFAVPVGAENPDLAALFVKYCLSGAVNEDNFSVWRSIPVIDSEFENVSLTKNGDPMYALIREIANSPENGIPGLCAVAGELGQGILTFREGVAYGNITDIEGELQRLQDKFQAELDKTQ